MPPKAKDTPAPEPAPEPLPSEQDEAAAVATAAPEPEAPEEEVRPEEFTAGIGEPVAGSAWPQEIVDELCKPLDPNRVRRRQGRGNTSLEYLAGHDVKRRASEIFGFGNWGHRVRMLEEIDAVQVRSSGDNPRDGWHVGYRCIVTVWILHKASLFETEGVGYGDGVEYSAAARVQACELAIKEAETDALKRAFTDLGDQFGLILYAKGDEKARLKRDSDAAASTSRPAVAAPPPGPTKPQNWTEALTRFDDRMGTNVKAEGYDYRNGVGAVWLEELCEKRFGSPSLAELNSDQRVQALVGFSSALMDLEEIEGEIALAPGLRDKVARAFAAKNEAVALVGPPWRLGPDEETLPTEEDYRAGLATGGEDLPEDGGGTPVPTED